MNYKKIVVIGGGILGTQIAFQTAYCGYDVTVLVHKGNAEKETQIKLNNLKNTYLETINLMNLEEGKENGNWARGIADIDNFDAEKCIKSVNTAYENIKIEFDYQKAFNDADLVIESITENLEAKISLYEQIASYLPEKTVVVTNSSTLLPSHLAHHTGRPEKYLALHFANTIWKNNTAEVMGHKDVDYKYFDELMAFADSIKMIALPVKEEKAGYLLNSMLVPLLLSAMDMVANNISDPESIDKAWTLGTGAPKGPFQIIDTVGLMTAKNIVEQYQKVPGLISPLLKKMMLPYNYKKMLVLLNKYIAEGKLGKSTGEGFYKYK